MTTSWFAVECSSCEVPAYHCQQYDTPCCPACLHPTAPAHPALPGSTASQGPGDPEFDARFRARWREQLRERLPATVTDEQFEQFCAEVEAAGEALRAATAPGALPRPRESAPRRPRPLRVNGEPIPRHILDGPPGEFARFCGETDPQVLAILDAEDE